MSVNGLSYSLSKIAPHAVMSPTVWGHGGSDPRLGWGRIVLNARHQALTCVSPNDQYSVGWEKNIPARCRGDQSRGLRPQLSDPGSGCPSPGAGWQLASPSVVLGIPGRVWYPQWIGWGPGLGDFWGWPGPGRASKPTDVGVWAKIRPFVSPDPSMSRGENNSPCSNFYHG